MFSAKETGNHQRGGSGRDGRAIEKKVVLALVRRRGAVSQPFLHGMREHSPRAQLRSQAKVCCSGNALPPFLGLGGKLL